MKQFVVICMFVFFSNEIVAEQIELGGQWHVLLDRDNLERFGFEYSEVAAPWVGEVYLRFPTEINGVYTLEWVKTAVIEHQGVAPLVTVTEYTAILDSKASWFGSYDPHTHDLAFIAYYRCVDKEGRACHHLKFIVDSFNNKLITRQ